MAFEFDSGPRGGSEYSSFINWHAQGTRDGAYDAKSFSCRDLESGDGEDVTKRMEKGVVVDINKLKTGWCFNEGVKGVSPDWRYNKNIARMENKPDERDDWQRGFMMPIALTKDRLVCWNQASTGVWEAMTRLAEQLAEEQPKNQGLLPVVAFTGTEELKFKKGGTTVPLLTIKKWTEAPPCLLEPIATEPDKIEDDDEEEF